MIKFIQLRDGKVFFGKPNEMHSNILNQHLEEILAGDDELSVCCGGGFADLENKKMWGRSVDFGKFDVGLARKTFPDWQIVDD